MDAKDGDKKDRDAASPRSADGSQIDSHAPSTARGGDLRFNLQRSQEMVFSAMPPDKTPIKFKKFYQSDLMHRFLSAALLYFDTMDKTHGLGEYKKKRLEEGSVNLDGEKEIEKRKKEMATVYANILLVYSSYEKPQQERQFFETLLEFTAKVLYTAFDRRDWLAIENELSLLFRSEQFNLSQRKNQEKEKHDQLSSFELYHLRHEGDPYSNSVYLAKLNPTRRSCSIHSAMNARSPLISSVLPTSQEQLKRTLREKKLRAEKRKQQKEREAMMANMKESSEADGAEDVNQMADEFEDNLNMDHQQAGHDLKGPMDGVTEGESTYDQTEVSTAVAGESGYSEGI